MTDATIRKTTNAAAEAETETGSGTRHPAVRIRNDAEALAAAHRLAADLQQEAATRDRDRRLPWAELDRFVGSGLWGISVPKEYGGAGVGSATLAEVIAIIAAADGSLGQIPQNHFYTIEVLRVNGSEAQKAWFFERVLHGDRFGNALAELGTKTSMERKTSLIRDGAAWRVNGRKFYATGALYADWIPTSAVDKDGIQQLAIIARHAEGVTVIDDWSGFGQRTTGSGSVVFDNVLVADSAVLPFQAAFARPTTVGPVAQLLHAAIDLGIARGAHRELLAFVQHRSRPWVDAQVARAADDPLTINDVGRLTIDLHAADALLARASARVDTAKVDPTAETVAAASIAVAEARVLTNDISLAAGSKLFELAGTQSTLSEHNLDRYWRNARTHTLHDPVRWKYHTIGNFYLNDKLPPRHGAL